MKEKFLNRLNLIERELKPLSLKLTNSPNDLPVPRQLSGIAHRCWMDSRVIDDSLS